jgi:hypothetical protein
MKTYKMYKKLAIAFWQGLNDNNLTYEEKQKDAVAFNKFFDKILFIIYICFSTFSLISLYFFVTRVIL